MPDDELKIDSGQAQNQFEAPRLRYRPPRPKNTQAGIGLIGCGGIASYHLEAYKAAGFNVVALCDVDEIKALARRDAYFPNANVSIDYRVLLAMKEVSIVDVAVHPEIRGPIIEEALNAGKHVLSQKPFVLDLDQGKRLADLADENGVKLAVNQNGRWAPHLSYMRRAIADGLIGEVTAVHMDIHWDHSWTVDTPFDEIPHLVLFDFGIHWFDILRCFLPNQRPETVYASVKNVPGQKNKAPMSAQVNIAYPNVQASIIFDAATQFGAMDRTYITGTHGTLASEGPDLSHQTVRLYTESGVAIPKLKGEWFKAGFLGSMSELMCAIEKDRKPTHNGRDNLESLEICFTAMASANQGIPLKMGDVRSLPAEQEK
jgi:predicted dehydrogenase